MPLARRFLLLSATLAVVAASPAAAASNGEARPLSGTRTDTLLLDTVTGLGTNLSTGQLSHLGRVTSVTSPQFIPGAGDAFTFFGSATITAANGDVLLATYSGSGVNTSPTTSMSTVTYTITGGTGRFTGASGTATETIHSKLVDFSGTIATYHDTATLNGTITY